MIVTGLPAAGEELAGVTVYPVATPATAFAENARGEPVRPGAVAVSLLAPAWVPSLQLPTVAAPSQLEAERLLGRTLLTHSHYLEAAERIRSMGPESVALSLGSRGAVEIHRVHKEANVQWGERRCSSLLPMRIIRTSNVANIGCGQSNSPIIYYYHLINSPGRGPLRQKSPAA